MLMGWVVNDGSGGQSSRTVAYNIDSSSRLAKCMMTIAYTYLTCSQLLIRPVVEMMHPLLQLAVLHRAAVEYSGQMIYNRVNDEWTSLFFLIDVSQHSRVERKSRNTRIRSRTPSSN